MRRIRPAHSLYRLAARQPFPHDMALGLRGSHAPSPATLISKQRVLFKNRGEGGCPDHPSTPCPPPPGGLHSGRPTFWAKILGSRHFFWQFVRKIEDPGNSLNPPPRRGKGGGRDPPPGHETVKKNISGQKGPLSQIKKPPAEGLKISPEHGNGALKLGYDWRGSWNCKRASRSLLSAVPWPSTPLHLGTLYFQSWLQLGFLNALCCAPPFHTNTPWSLTANWRGRDKPFTKTKAEQNECWAVFCKRVTGGPSRPTSFNNQRSQKA